MSDFKPCGSGDNICNCKSQEECGYVGFHDDINDTEYCQHCEDEMSWEDCYQCGGEGGRDYEDLQFEDPLWYVPGDYESCDTCKGKGGYYICFNYKNHKNQNNENR